jgi:hypothetical protein
MNLIFILCEENIRNIGMDKNLLLTFYYLSPFSILVELVKKHKI